MLFVGLVLSKDTPYLFFPSLLPFDSIGCLSTLASLALELSTVFLPSAHEPSDVNLNDKWSVCQL